MLTHDECLALAELTAEERAVIVEHAHRPDVVAFDASGYVQLSPDGVMRIHEFIRDDIEAALQARDFVESARLKLVVRRLLEQQHGRTIKA
ncbi:MAG TPA: hypothetical protein VMB81_21100 [Candidatus Sulfotelmatobacter sp.]|nr:hypothetical protein [Candidatus Sulfotelmatobacter sp.]